MYYMFAYPAIIIADIIVVDNAENTMETFDRESLFS